MHGKYIHLIIDHQSDDDVSYMISYPDFQDKKKHLFHENLQKKKRKAWSEVLSIWVFVATPENDTALQVKTLKRKEGEKISRCHRTPS